MSDTLSLASVTDDSFAAEVEAHDGLTVVDFWAPWCGPCRMLAPVVERLAAQHVDRVRVVKINADDNQRTTVRFGVRGLPTLLFFKSGQLVDRVMGAVPYAAVEAAALKHA
jgi:thioredoxin 1